MISATIVVFLSCDAVRIRIRRLGGNWEADGGRGGPLGALWGGSARGRVRTVRPEVGEGGGGMG